MDFRKLFEIQKVLDAAIIKKKGLVGRDLLPEKILALQVELGECANEWRGFKFWSNNQKPVVRVNNPIKHGNPLLEEYVDCLHFILSIGLELKMQDCDFARVVRINNPTKLFSDLMLNAGVLGYPESDNDNNYPVLVATFIKLGEILGFTWEQIESAYMEKNAINHTRQDTGY